VRLPILALDLSLINTGWARYEDGMDHAGSIQCPSSGTEVNRMVFVADQVVNLQDTPADWWLEQGFAMASHGASGGMVAELRGMLRYLIHPQTFTEVTPLTLKVFATGYGHAKKEQMIEAVESWGFKVPTLRPKGAKKNDGVADAIVLREFAMACRGKGRVGDIDYARKWWAKQDAKAA
jgi:Holliday junction resolvasome RuvABC endonuclease subunit